MCCPLELTRWCKRRSWYRNRPYHYTGWWYSSHKRTTRPTLRPGILSAASRTCLACYLKCRVCKHIEVLTKWTLSCNLHFEMHSLDRKCLCFDTIFHLLVPRSSVVYTNNGLTPNRRQVFNLTHDNPVHWRIYVSPRTFYQHGLTLIPAWINNHITGKVWDVITYPFPNIKIPSQTSKVELLKFANG